MAQNMSDADWTRAMDAVIAEHFGARTGENPGTGAYFFPGRQTARGDQSRSFKYGRTSGLWYDYSASQGGRGVYSLCEYLGYARDDIADYLRSLGVMPEGKGKPSGGRKVAKPPAPKPLARDALVAAMDAADDATLRACFQAVEDALYEETIPTDRQKGQAADMAEGLDIDESDLPEPLLAQAERRGPVTEDEARNLQAWDDAIDEDDHAARCRRVFHNGLADVQRHKTPQMGAQ